MIPKMRHALYQDLGVRFPGVHVRTDSPNIEPDEYSIFLNEVPVLRGKIPQGCLLTNEPPENLRRFNIPFNSTKNSLGQTSQWVEIRYEEILKKAGIKYWKPLEVVILHLSYFYRQHASDFIGIQEVRGIMEFIEKAYPDLSKEVTRLIPLQKLTDIFKRLVQEQISIKDLRTILEALSEWAQTEKDVVLYRYTSLIPKSKTWCAQPSNKPPPVPISLSIQIQRKRLFKPSDLSLCLPQLEDNPLYS
jgi:type III secretion protein V